MPGTVCVYIFYKIFFEGIEKDVSFWGIYFFVSKHAVDSYFVIVLGFLYKFEILGPNFVYSVDYIIDIQNERFHFCFSTYEILYMVNINTWRRSCATWAIIKLNLLS